MSVAKDLEVKEISEEQEGEDDTENEAQTGEFTQEAGIEETVEFQEEIESNGIHGYRYVNNLRLVHVCLR